MSVKPGVLANLFNVVAFQVVWFATVLGAADGLLWPGLVTLGLFFALHWFISHTERADLQLAIIAVCLGFCVESGFAAANLLVHSVASLKLGLVPAWLLVLWANFALIMNGCLIWLHGRYLLAAVLGFAGAPLSYYGGVVLGAAEAGAPLYIVLPVVGLAYALVTPGLLFAARRLAYFHRDRAQGSRD